MNYKFWRDEIRESLKDRYECSSFDRRITRHYADGWRIVIWPESVDHETVSLRVYNKYSRLMIYEVGIIPEDFLTVIHNVESQVERMKLRENG